LAKDLGHTSQHRTGSNPVSCHFLTRRGCQRFKYWS